MFRSPDGTRVFGSHRLEERLEKFKNGRFLPAFFDRCKESKRRSKDGKKASHAADCSSDDEQVVESRPFPLSTELLAHFHNRRPDPPLPDDPLEMMRYMFQNNMFRRHQVVLGRFHRYDAIYDVVHFHLLQVRETTPMAFEPGAVVSIECMTPRGIVRNPDINLRPNFTAGSLFVATVMFVHQHEKVLELTFFPRLCRREFIPTPGAHPLPRPAISNLPLLPPPPLPPAPNLSPALSRTAATDSAIHMGLTDNMWFATESAQSVIERHYQTAIKGLTSPPSLCARAHEPRIVHNRIVAP